MFKFKVLKKYKNYQINKSDIIVVFGGDGFMLSVIRKYFRYKKPFYGINFGNYGFLLNKYKDLNIEKQIKESIKIIINPLEGNITTTKKNNKKKLFAVNEFSFLRQTKQTSCLNIKINNKSLSEKLIGDGLIISTPIGSTAYNYSAGGQIIKINSNKLSIVPVNPFRSKFRQPKIINNNSQVLVNNLRLERPVSISADNYEVRNLLSANIFLNKNIKIYLLFNNKKKFQ